MMLWVTFYPSYLQYTLTEQMLNHVSVSSAKEQAVRKRDCLLWSDFVYSENSCVVFLILRMTALGNWFWGRLSAHVGRQETEWMMLISLWQVPVSCPPILIMWGLARRSLLWKADTESTCTWGRSTSSWNVFPPSLSTCFCTFLFFPFFSSFFSFLTDRISH